MKISLYDRPPVLDTAGDFDDSDLLQSFSQTAREFNRPGGFIDALRKGTAGFLRSFVPNNDIEADRMQSLIGNEQARLNDPIGQQMTQAEWDAHMRENADSARYQNFMGIRSLADYIEPTPHAEPDTLLGKAAYKAGEYIPGIAGTIAEVMTLGWPLTTLLNSAMGTQNTQQQVYSNQLNQGKSIEEARSIADNPLPNLADFGIRGATNALTLYALNKPYPGIESGISPIAHTLRNIGTAMGISGTGAAGNQALTNYRSDKENTLAGLANTGASAAAATGVMGLIGAGLRAKQLWNAQKEYNANRPINAEWRDITPPDDPNGLGSGNNPNTPPNSPFGGADIVTVPANNALPQGTLQLPEFTSRNIAARLNNAIVQRGFNPITNDFQPNALARQIAAYVGNGYISQEDALSMLQDGGLSPEQARGFLDTGLAEILERTRVPEQPKQPTDIVLDRVANHPQTNIYRRNYEDYANLDEAYSDFGGDNSAPLQDIDDSLTYSPSKRYHTITPAEFLADIQAKKRQLGYDIRRREKELGISHSSAADKDKIYASAERKTDNLNANLQEATGKLDSLKKPSERKNTYTSLLSVLAHQNKFDETKNNVDNLGEPTGKNDTPKIPQTPQIPHFLPSGNEQAYYEDDYYSDNTGDIPRDNSNPWQDIPDSLLPDTQQEERRLTPYSDKRFYDGTLSVRDDNGNFSEVNIVLNNGQHSFDFYSNGYLGSYNYKNNKLTASEGADSEARLRSAFQAFREHFDDFYIPPQSEDAPQAPQDTLTTTGKPSDELRNIAMTQQPNADITFDEALRNVAEKLHQDTTNHPGQWLDIKNLWDFMKQFPQNIQDEIYSYLDKHHITTARTTADGGRYVVNNHDALNDILKIDTPTGKSSDELRNIAQTETQKQEQFISIGDITNAFLRNEQNIPDRLHDIGAYDKRHDVYNEAVRKAILHNEELFRSVDSPEKLTAMLREVNNDTGITPPSGNIPQLNRPKEQQIASLVLSRFPDYQPAKDALRIPVLQPVALYYSGNKNPLSGNQGWTAEVASSDRKNFKERFDSNIHALEKLSDEADIVQALHTLEDKDIYAMAKELGLRIDKKNPARSFARQFLKRNAKSETPTPKPAPATADSYYPFNLEDSYQGMPKSELKAAADKNNALISSIKDEDTLRKRISGLHVPMLRAMSGITGSGYHKDDFINEIVRKTIKPFPDGARLKAGEFSVPGVNGSWTVKPNGAGNVFHIENKDIPSSFMIYDVNDNYFLNTLGGEAIDKAQAYFREHAKDFYDTDVGDNQQSQTAPQLQQQKHETPKKTDKTKLMPLGNDNPDEISELNLDILRSIPTDDARKKLLNAQSMTTADLKRMREYIMRKYHVGMGVQGKRNDIINSIVKFIRKDPKAWENIASQIPINPDTQTDTTQPQEETQTNNSENEQPAANDDDMEERRRKNREAEEKRVKFHVGEVYKSGDNSYTVVKITGNPRNFVVFTDQNGNTIRKQIHRRRRISTRESIETDEYIQNPDVNSIKHNLIAGIEHANNVSQVFLVTPSDNSDEQVLKQEAHSDSPVVRLAQRVRDYILDALNGFKHVIPLDNNILRKWAEFEFGGTIGEGKYDQKQAYDAMEMGINMAILKHRISPANVVKYNYMAGGDIADLLNILNVIPTQTNRTPEQVEAQQFSTPPTLAYLVNWLANIGKGNTVLEPSAGTGNLAVFAHNAGAKLILNDFSESGLRADILDALGWGKVYREDAMQLGNILAGEVRDGQRSENEMPDRVIMNPPFSSAWNLGGNNKNQNGFKHVMSALTALKHGGRLIAILGAGRDGSASSVKTWLKHIGKVYNVRALITVGGKAYQKYGTTFSNAIVVIDNTGATPKGGTVEFAFSGDFANDEEVRKLFEAMQDIRDDINGGEDSLPRDDSTPPKPEPPKPAPTPEPAKKSDTPSSSGKRIIPEGAILKEGSFTAKGHIHKEAQYKVKPAKRDYIHRIADILEIKNGVEPSFVYDPEYDSFSHDGYADSGEELKPYVEKAFREHINDFYELPQKKSGIPDTIKNNLALMNIYDYLDGNTDLTLKVDKAIRASMEAGFRNNEQKKRQIQSAIYNTLLDTGFDDKSAENLTNQIFSAVMNKKGYDNEHTEKPEQENVNSAGIPNALKESEEILAKLDHDSYDELKDSADSLGTDTDSLITGGEDSVSGRIELRAAIKKALKADNEHLPQENKPQQKQEQPENNTQPNTKIDSSEPTEKASVSRKSAKELDKERKALREQDKDNSIQSTYTPTIITQGAKHHPADLVESSVMRSVPLPTVNEKTNIPQFIIDEGRLSDAQMEAVTLAVNSFSHILPNGYRRGFFIGDGTGVGKGREISGIIMDTLSRGAGNGKAIWISNGHTLIKDAKRDWQGLGNNPNDIFPQKGSDAKKNIKQTKGILFTAYSHMASKDRIKQLREWLGENWDGIIVLDEAHNANNVLGTNAATRALNTRDFIKAFPKARILYVSATGATKLENFAMLDRLGIWGYEGAPFESAQAFNEQLSKGGIAAMEVAARDFKAMGLFLARSLSMRAGPYGGNENVTFRTLEHNLTDDNIEIYDALAEIWQMIEQEMPQIMIARGYDPKKGKDAAKWKSVFWGAHQRFFNQIITSLQTDETILDMQKQLDAGNSCLVQLTNTLEANLNRAIKKGKHINSNDEDSVDSDFDLSPKDILIEMVNNLFDPRVVEYYEDDEGNEKVREAHDTSGKLILSDAVLRKKQHFIDLINSINRFPQSPIDKILNFFGHENVAEITGRSQRPRVFVDKNTGKKSNLETGRTDAVRNAEIDDFNSGKRRILIFSEKGGTGASYHASNDYENKQKRIHYMLQAGWAADKALQGLGRSNRSNEAHKPEYVLVTTDIPGQKRFISTIARRLAQLGALTTGERRTATSGMFSEGDNLEASYVDTALGRFIGNLLSPLKSRENPYPELDPNDVVEQLGYKQEKLKDIDITTFLNRLLAMTVEMQKLVFARFQQEIDAVKEVYLANGTDIDAPAENIKALSINIINEQNIHHSDLFGTDTNYLELEITRNMNPRNWLEIQYQMDIGVKYRFYTLQSGKIVAAVKSGRTYDTETGQMIPTYRLVQPDRRKVEYGITDKILSNLEPNQKRKFTAVDAKTAQALWSTQTDELPDTFTATEHMITGAMLPVWSLIEDYPKVWRITTDDGREFLGRIIPNKQLQKVLQALHIKFESKKYNADSIKKALDKRGTIVTLLNKAKLKFSRVSGEKLLEIIPVDEWQGRAIKRAGLISMIINSKERFFFPKGNDELLNTYLEKNPVAGEPVEIDDADEIIAEAVDTINSSIDASDSGHLHIIHPSFWGFINDPDDNPLIHKSNYPLDSEPREYRYQASKNADSSKSAWQHLKDFGAKIWKGRHDIPELADEKGRIDDSLVKAQEWLRGLKRERQANVHETEKQLRTILTNEKGKELSPDDFDLFQRAMELRDLNETHSNDPNADMPWDLNPPAFFMRDPVRENYAAIMQHVRKNPRVQKAMDRADVLMEDLRNKLIDAADRLGMFDVRDRLKRKFYFRHLVLEYYNMQRSGKPHPTFKNPTARGYMKHREGSDKDISSNWILAMGEVFTRMFDDIKILDTLFKLRQEYDIIEDLRQQALNYNMENALARIMRGLQDVPDELRKAAAEKKLRVVLNTTQARAMTRLFNLAKKGDLPVGNNHEWQDLVSRMAEAGQLDNLSHEEHQKLSRYIGWLSDMPASTPARKAAKTFLTGIKSRIRAMKSILGGDYLDWQDLIPDDHTIWSPSDSRLVFSASTLPEYMLKIATDNIDALLGADASDIGKMISSGGDKQLWVIPTRLADALDNIGKSQPMGAFGQIMTKLMSAFKRWVTIGPANGRLFKYNWRNFFGDIEAVLQGNPGALYYFNQAAKELTDVMLKGGIATGTLEEFQKRGGGLTTEAMTELERPDRIKEFSHLFEQKKTSNPLKWGVKALREYLYIATTLTNFRESILRYAAFLSYIQLIKDNNGVPPFYGMSKPREVKAVGDDIYDIAFKLANENLGAYDQISSNLQWLRDNNFVSFLSWVEVNTKRYARLMANIWQGNSYLEWWLKRKGQKFIDDLIGSGGGGDKEPLNNGGGSGGDGNNEPPKDNNGGDFADDDGDNEFRKLFRRLAKKSAVGALRLAITLALAAPLWGLLSIWNMLNSDDDEKLPPDVRNKPHLTIGHNAFTGEVQYMGDIGSAFDALQMFGVGNLITGDLRDLLDGRTTFGEIAANIIDGPVSKLVSNANPFAKAVVEGFFGKRTFPSALHPTPIRDKGRFVAQSFGLEWYYDFLTDKPHKPFYDFSSSVVNSSNQDSSAYFYMISRRKQFEENVLGKYSDFMSSSIRNEAMRNAKDAADLGDRKAVRKYLHEFFVAGGSRQGLKISARTMEPLYGLNDTDKLRFVRWLPKEERKILRRAMRYAERLKARLGVW